MSKYPKLDIILIGRITIDINPKDFTIPFVNSRYFQKFVGGSPANTAIGLAKLGCKAGFIGRVSDDSLGDYVLSYLQETGVDISNIRKCENGENMGLGFTETTGDGRSNVMIYRNGPVADLQLETEDVDEEYIESAKIIVISGTSFAAQPSRDAVFKALFLARKRGKKVVFDLDYRPQTWKNADEVSVYYTLAAQFADIIIGSRDEFDFMDAIIAGNGESNEETAERWFKTGAELLVIKHGKEGSYAYERNGKSFRILPYAVESLKTTGGGDAYASAMLSGMIRNMPLETCLERGTASASMAVSADNCSDALPDEERLNEFIEKRHDRGEQVIFPI